MPSGAIPRLALKRMKFRVRKFYQILGIACTALFFVATVGNASVFFLEHPEDYGYKGEHSVVIVGSFGTATFGCMTLLGVYILLAYYKVFVEVDGATIRLQTVFRFQRFDASEIQTVTWRTAGASVLLGLPGRSRRIELGNFSETDQLSIIRLIRSLTPTARHERWDLFCHRVALPLRDGILPTVRVDNSVQLVTIDRSRYDRLLLMMLAPTLLTTFALCWCLETWVFVVLPVLVAGFWLLLRFNTPKEGNQQVRLVSSPSGRAQAAAHILMPTTVLLLLVLALAGVEKNTAFGIVAVVAVPSLIAIIFAAIRANKHERMIELQGAESADEAWRTGELKSNA
jgi:hypothetical protein